MKILSPCALLLFVSTIAPQGFWNHVYGDQSTKKYYSIECSEPTKINESNLQGFKTPAAAEKAGVTKGETCSALPPSRAFQFFGDKSTKSFFPILCTGNVTIASDDWITFETKSDAEKAGYKIAACPVILPVNPPIDTTPKTSPARRISLKRAVLPRIVAITSEPSEWLGKLVTVDADVNITDLWKYDENTYAFRITDGSAGFYLYMEKKSAKPLRDLILRQPAADGVYGQFTFYLDPNGYLLMGDLYGRLVAYSVRAD